MNKMISKKQKKYLRMLSHENDPVILIGQNGLTENVKIEIDNALDHHELIKIKIRVGDRDIREQLTAEIIEATGAIVIKKIGNVVTIYRSNPDAPVISLPG